MNEEVQAALHQPIKKELKEISVAGKVQLYKNKPQIVLKSPAQIQSIITESPAVGKQ